MIALGTEDGDGEGLGLDKRVVVMVETISHCGDIKCGTQISFLAVSQGCANTTLCKKETLRDGDRFVISQSS